MSDGISAVNVVARSAVHGDGRIGTITNLLDSDGEETEDEELAVGAVVRLADNEWYAIDLRDYETVRNN